MSGPRLGPIARWVLARSVPATELEAVEGDLLESAREAGKGRLWLAGQAWLLATGFVIDRAFRGRTPEPSATDRSMPRGGGGFVWRWWKDLSVSARSLTRRPGFAAVVIGTLALGIGANTAIFTVIRSAVLFELPFHDPERVLFHSDGYGRSGAWGSSMSIPNFLDIKQEATALEGIEAFWYRSVNMAADERPLRATTLAVGPDFIEVIGIRPALGRDFNRDDNVLGAADVAVLGHELWVERFGSDPSIVGRQIEMDDKSYTVVGVLPESFEFPGDPRVLVPIQYEGRESSRSSRGYNAVSRLAEGASLESAQAELDAIFARLESAFPESNRDWVTDARPIREWMVRSSTRRSLGLLSIAVVVVLLIACANVANLLLVRSESRHRELAVRVAMGAGRARLLPLFLTESLLLGLAGGVAGVALAYAALPVLVSLFGDALPRAETIALDGSVLAFALGLSVVTGVLVGILPALRVDLKELGAHLKEGNRAVSRGGHRLRHGLVIAEVALTVVLVAGAALLVKSFWKVSAIDTGLDSPDQVLVATVTLSPGSYPDAESWSAFFEELVTSVEALPGVVAAGMTNRLPLFGGYNITDLFVHNDTERVSHFVEIRYVSPGFFDALGLELLAGRPLTRADAEEGSDVVITDALARQLFGDARSAVGASLLKGGADEPIRVVGVVSDLRDRGITSAAPPGIYHVYGPKTNHGYGAILTVRTAGPPLDLLPTVRDRVAAMDPTLPVYDTRILQDVVDQALGGRRFSMSLLALFAALAMVLGAVGLYGVMAYSVAERTREIGVRMALGAEASSVVGQVLRRGMALTALGLVVGVGAALGLGRFVSSFLYEVESSDPLVHLAVAGLALLMTALACWLPARRASTVNPVEALRHD